MAISFPFLIDWQVSHVRVYSQPDGPGRSAGPDAGDGREIWLEASYNPVFERDGKITHVVKFASDITARMHELSDQIDNARQIMRTSNESLERAEQAAALVEASAAGMVTTANKASTAAEAVEELQRSAQGIGQIADIRQRTLAASTAMTEVATASSASVGSMTGANEAMTGIRESARASAEVTRVQTEKLARLMED